jgi:rubrerythrin
VQIADIFEETAQQEKEHAKRFFNFLEGGEIQIPRDFPPVSSAAHWTTSMRPPTASVMSTCRNVSWFAKIARHEGFDAIAMVWEAIAVAEKQHEKRYP